MLQLDSMATKINETADRSRILHGLAAWQALKSPSWATFVDIYGLLSLAMGRANRKILAFRSCTTIS
jgi:hypothetical protein